MSIINNNTTLQNDPKHNLRKSTEIDILGLFGSLPVKEQSERDFNIIREQARFERLEKRKKGEKFDA